MAAREPVRRKHIARPAQEASGSIVRLLDWVLSTLLRWLRPGIRPRIQIHGSLHHRTGPGRVRLGLDAYPGTGRASAAGVGPIQGRALARGSVGRAARPYFALLRSKLNGPAISA